MSLSSVGVAPSSCPGHEHQSREDFGWIPDAGFCHCGFSCLLYRTHLAALLILRKDDDLGLRSFVDRMLENVSDQISKYSDEGDSWLSVLASLR